MFDNSNKLKSLFEVPEHAKNAISKQLTQKDLEEKEIQKQLEEELRILREAQENNSNTISNTVQENEISNTNKYIINISINQIKNIIVNKSYSKQQLDAIENLYYC